VRWLLLALLLAGCRTDEVWIEPDFDLNRMARQPRLDPYEPGAMMLPPEGTRTFAPEPIDRRLIEGRDENGNVLTQIPVPLSRALLVHGRGRYDTFCAPCHGVRGTGQTPVAERMQLRPPPSLHQPRIRNLQPGDVYQIVSHGYGLMPGYQVQLTPDDRWAVVAYLRVLQRSQDVSVAALGPAQREALERAAPAQEAPR
jgi:mono/diheme cytochrome c family protein